MNKDAPTEELVKSLYNSIMEKPNKVLEIFNNFFGEERVELQGYCTYDSLRDYIKGRRYSEAELHDLKTDIRKYKPLERAIIEDKYSNLFILVHFPHVTVTNEYDRSVEINHLWAKVYIDVQGKMNGGFGLNRSEYTISHITSNYLHSHVYEVPRHDFTRFQTPCMGSGPIRSTITTLTREYDEGFWELFCLELSKYVTVESLTGVPYHKLESIGAAGMKSLIGNFTVQENLWSHSYRSIIAPANIRDFVRYFVNCKCLKFNYANGSYSIGMTFLDYMVLISNKFIEWYNMMYNSNKCGATYEMLTANNVIKEGAVLDGKIYFKDDINRINNCESYEGRKVCTFKGKDITIHISDLQVVHEDNLSRFLNVDIALYILNKIIKVLNYRYGRNKAVKKPGHLTTETRYL